LENKGRQIMAQAVVTITIARHTNDQRFQRYVGTLTIGPAGGTYSPGGLPLDSVLQAFLLPQTNLPPLRVTVTSDTGSGYIYQRIAATGKLMILQVPLSGSLTTAAPLSEVLAGNTLSQVNNDVISFEAVYLRNAS
jgi:hypothetical protein